MARGSLARWLVAATEATCWVNDVVKIAAAAAVAAVARTDTVSFWQPQRTLRYNNYKRSFFYYAIGLLKGREISQDRKKQDNNSEAR